MRYGFRFRRWSILGLGIAGIMLVILARKVVFRGDGSAERALPDLGGSAEVPPLAGRPPADDGPPAAADLQQLRRIEARCVELLPRIRPAVVGVISPSKAALPRDGLARGGSGVIISPDGLVLSQMHVSHTRADAGDLNNAHAPGEEAVVLLAEGRECKARLLGANRTYDLSLLQLSEPATYPFVALRADAWVRKGDWVLKLGHPMGPRAGRPPPARLGRVLGSTAEAFVTDCRTVTGDSGGPYFDLDGNLVGIMNLADADISARYSSGRKDDVWFMTISAARIASLLEALQQGTVPPAGRRGFVLGVERIVPLPVEHRTQGAAQSAVVRHLGETLRGDVIEIVNGGVPVGLATVVDDGGHAVAKATILPPQPKCRLSDGSIVAVDVMGADKAFDLAVLRLPEKAHRPVAWTSRIAPVAPGTVTVAVGAHGGILSLGIVSAGPRRLSQANHPVYDLPLRVKAAAPGLSGHVSQAGAFVLDSIDDLAAAAGLKPADRLISIAGHRIAAQADVPEAVRNRASGDLVEVVFVSGAETLTTRLPLRADAGVWGGTFRSDHFPVALEYSPAVLIDQCGGPLVDLDGKLIGLTVGSPAVHAGWGIPVTEVLRLAADAKAGRLEPWGQGGQGP